VANYEENENDVLQIYFQAFSCWWYYCRIVKGQDARQKWVTKKKIRYEARKAQQNMSTDRTLVALDEIEMSTYHS
jgi:hypothetical protein